MITVSSMTIFASNRLQNHPGLAHASRIVLQKASPAAIALWHEDFAGGPAKNENPGVGPGFRIAAFATSRASRLQQDHLPL